MAAWDRSPPGTHPVLVHGTSDCLFLATPDVRLLVHSGATAGGGKLFSDPMARGSFILFLLLSTPVGLHHQFTDPGIGQGWKLTHAFLTFAVFFPSLLTFLKVLD